MLSVCCPADLTFKFLARLATGTGSDHRGLRTLSQVLQKAKISAENPDHSNHVTAFLQNACQVCSCSDRLPYTLS